MPTLTVHSRRTPEAVAAPAALVAWSGPRLRSLRLRAGLTRTALEALLEEEAGGLRHYAGTVKRWESTAGPQDLMSGPSFRDALALCRVLGCSVEDLAEEFPIVEADFPGLARAREKRGISIEEAARRLSRIRRCFGQGGAAFLRRMEGRRSANVMDIALARDLARACGIPANLAIRRRAALRATAAR